MGGAGCVWGRKKSGWGVSRTISELSASTPTSGPLQPRTRGNGAERWNKGRNISWRNKWIAAEKPKAGLRHAVVCPNVTGRTKERIPPKASGLVLVRSPLLTSHTWRELISSGYLVCRCHDVFLLCYPCFILLHCAFVEAAALR